MHAELSFQPGLIVLVGGNNVGETAVADALRALLAGYDEAHPRLSEDDVHWLTCSTPSSDIVFEYVFSDLSLDNEADVLLRRLLHVRVLLVNGETLSVAAHVAGFAGFANLSRTPRTMFGLPPSVWQMNLNTRAKAQQLHLA